VMMAALALAQGVLAPYYSQGAAMKVAALSTVILIGMAVFGAAVLAMKAYDMGMIRGLLKRKRGA